MGRRVLDWDTVAVLYGRQRNERTLAVLDGRKSPGLGHGGVANREGECWYGAVVNGRLLNEWRWNSVILKIPAKHKEVPCRSAFLLIVRICYYYFLLMFIYLSLPIINHDDL